MSKKFYEHVSQWITDNYNFLFSKLQQLYIFCQRYFRLSFKKLGLVTCPLSKVCSTFVFLIFIILTYQLSSLYMYLKCQTAGDDSFSMSECGLQSPASFPAITSGIKKDNNTKSLFSHQLDNIHLDCLENLSSDLIFSAPNENVIHSDNGLKTILVMVGNYGHKDLGFGFGKEPFETACCKQHRCFITDNRNLLPVEKFDAIIFHYRTLLPQDLPRKRSPDQRYILFDLEPSAYLFQDPKIYDGIFNWTMNFRSDSDIPFVYGRMLSRMIPLNTSNENFASGKSHLVAWFVSRCSSLSWREHYVEGLRQYIPVDIYGSCGELTCSQSYFDECYEMAEKTYKFYLSFENSLCQDYITEKFFNILRYNIIPIVFGGGDYEMVAPPHSYINVMDFKDIKALSEYLLYLDKNDTAYNEYFRWKLQYFIPSFWSNIAINFCYLCKKLHEKTMPYSYNDLETYIVDQANCRRIKPISWLERLLSSKI